MATTSTNRGHTPHKEPHLREQGHFLSLRTKFASELASLSLFSSREVNPKSATVPVTSNLAAHAWSIKCRRKKKLITQFSCKSRDKSFEPN
jgi:hypothetical protein